MPAQADDTDTTQQTSDASPPNPEWADLIRWRKAKGLSQQRLGEVCGKTQAAVSGWERGLYPPDLHLIPAISEALGQKRDVVLLSMADVFLPNLNS